MSSPFAKPVGGGGIFKSADALNDLAIIFEPLSITKNVENTYQGRTNYRDEVACDITVFANSESLETGTPTAIHKGVRVVHGMMCGDLERNIGGVMLAVVRKVPTKQGSGYALREATPENEELAAKYYLARQAEIEAALADVPSFD